MATNVFGVGAAPIQYSITNSDVSAADALDNFQPFSFFEYLKYSQQTTTPELFTKRYNDYLLLWYDTQNVAADTRTDELRTRYVDLLKDLAINFTTSEEKRFLNNLDYDDPEDLAIAIPFYAQKLKDICLFYARKRDTFKYRIEEVKVKGTEFSIEKAILNTVFDFINVSDEKYGNTFRNSLSAIAQDLQISIEEYVDIFPNYFNVDPYAAPSNYGSTNKLRSQYYTSNVNAISASLFLGFDQTILSEILNTPIYLKEIGSGLYINPSRYVNDALKVQCDPSIIAKLISTDSATLSADYALKKRLLEKYIGTDFYYLSTNSHTSFVSGSLFKATAPSNNLLNSRFNTTASVPENDLARLRDIGLFFKPDKMGVIQFVPTSSHFIIDSSKLERDKIYIFPDPTTYGNVANTHFSDLHVPLIHVVDNTSYVCGLDQGIAAGDVQSNEYIQNLYAYFSAPLYINSDSINVSAYSAGLSRIFERGTFTKYAQDVFGNEYGLLKPITRYEKPQANESTATTQCITIDGHRFYDDYEGFNFDFSVVGDNSDGSIRSGLTAKTADLFPPFGGSFTSGYNAASATMFTLTGDTNSLYFREFTPYIECGGSSPNFICVLRDGGSFVGYNNQPLPDVSSDSTSWNSNSRVYYTTLCDAGMSASFVMVPGGLYAAMSSVPTLSSTLFESFDCRYFPNICTTQNEYNYVNLAPSFISHVSVGCESVLDAQAETGSETINTINSLAGTILVKNASTNIVLPLSSALSATYSKYSDSVKEELYNSVEYFNIFYTCLFIQTSSYSVFDSIEINTAGEFIKPGTRNTVITVDDNAFSSMTNVFFREDQNDVWIVKTRLLDDSLSASNTKTIYPEIYKYELGTDKFIKTYPGLFTTSADISATFSFPLTGVNATSLNSAKLTYSSFNDLFNITWIVNDLNGLAYLASIDFKDKNDSVVFDDAGAILYTPTTTNSTYNFFYPLSSFTDLQVLSSTNAAITKAQNTIYF